MIKFSETDFIRCIVCSKRAHYSVCANDSVLSVQPKRIGVQENHPRIFLQTNQHVRLISIFKLMSKQGSFYRNSATLQIVLLYVGTVITN